MALNAFANDDRPKWKLAQWTKQEFTNDVGSFCERSFPLCLYNSVYSALISFDPFLLWLSFSSSFLTLSSSLFSLHSLPFSFCVLFDETESNFRSIGSIWDKIVVKQLKYTKFRCSHNVSGRIEMAKVRAFMENLSKNFEIVAKFKRRFIHRNEWHFISNQNRRMIFQTMKFDLKRKMCANLSHQNEQSIECQLKVSHRTKMQ